MTVTLPAQDLTLPPTWAPWEVGGALVAEQGWPAREPALENHCPSLMIHDLGVGEGPSLHQEERPFKPSAQGTS